MNDLVLEMHTKQIEDVCRKYDVAELSLFGSLARGEASGQSDIDLLVSFSRRKSLLTLIRLQRELSNILQREVDLVTERALSPYIKDRVLSDLRVIYATR
jgi:hypothetical protein